MPPHRYAVLVSSPFPTSSSSYAIHRGSCPLPKHLPFLRSLHPLTSIISLTPRPLHEYAPAVVEWASASRINLLHVPVSLLKVKKKTSLPDPRTIVTVLALLLDKANLPCYIHDEDGSDLLSLVGACLRKLQGWSENAYKAEMARYALRPPAFPPNSKLTTLSRSYLRLPPPAPESLQYVREFLSNTSSTDSDLVLIVPPSSTRAPWLWPSGMPSRARSTLILTPTSDESATTDEPLPSHSTMHVLVDQSQGEDQERLLGESVRKVFIGEHGGGSTRKERLGGTGTERSMSRAGRGGIGKIGLLGDGHGSGEYSSNEERQSETVSNSEMDDSTSNFSTANSLDSHSITLDHPPSHSSFHSEDAPKFVRTQSHSNLHLPRVHSQRSSQIGSLLGSSSRDLVWEGGEEGGDLNYDQATGLVPSSPLALDMRSTLQIAEQGEVDVEEEGEVRTPMMLPTKGKGEVPRFAEEEVEEDIEGLTMRGRRNRRRRERDSSLHSTPSHTPPL